MPGKKGSPDSQFLSPAGKWDNGNEGKWDDGNADCKRLLYINEGDNRRVNEGSSDKFEENKASGNDDNLLFYSSNEEYNEDVRYLLAIYLQRNMEFPRRIITSMYFWHMAQYCEIGGKSKFTTTSLRYMCVMLRLGAQVSRELIILCTNLTVRLI